MPYSVGKQNNYLCLTPDEADGILKSNINPLNRNKLTKTQRHILWTRSKFQDQEVLEYPDALEQYFAVKSNNDCDSKLDLTPKIEQLRKLLQTDNPEDIDNLVCLDSFFRNMNVNYYALCVKHADFNQTIRTDNRDQAANECLDHILYWIRTKDQQSRARNAILDEIVSNHMLVLDVMKDIYTMYQQKFTTIKQLNNYYARQHLGITRNISIPNRTPSDRIIMLGNTIELALSRSFLTRISASYDTMIDEFRASYPNS